MYFPHEKVQPKRQRSPPPGACRCAAKLYEHEQPAHSAACSGQLPLPKRGGKMYFPHGKVQPKRQQLPPPGACRCAAKLFEHEQPAHSAACPGQLPSPKRGGKMYFPPRFGDPTGTRTRVTAVKGRCLNRLTMGPYRAARRRRMKTAFPRRGFRFAALGKVLW